MSGPGIPGVRDGRRGPGMFMQNCLQFTGWEPSPQTEICSLHHPGPTPAGTLGAGSRQAGATRARACASLQQRWGVATASFPVVTLDAAS